MGNRLQAMVSAFLFAVVTKRLLLVDWAENGNQIVRACNMFSAARAPDHAPVIISSMPSRAFTFAHATRCLQLSFTGLTLICRSLFPLLKSPACRPSIPSSLLHTRGLRKALTSATFSGRSHQATERLSLSMVTRTGVDLAEGEVACGVFLGLLFCGVEYHV